MAGAVIGAKNETLIKGGHALEANRISKRVVLDKPGTITEVKLTVMTADGVTMRADVSAMLSATEARPERSLAKAVAVWGKDVSSTNAPETSVDAFESITGQGVRATVAVVARAQQQKKYTVWVGSGRLVAQTDDFGGGLPAGLAEFELQEAQKGRTLMYVAISSSAPTNPLPVLAFALADAPKRSSARAIRALQDMGIEMNLMTGDGRASALVVARQVGIAPEGVWVDMSLEGKASVVAELMEKHGGGVATVRVVLHRTC